MTSQVYFWVLFLLNIKWTEIHFFSLVKFFFCYLNIEILGKHIYKEDIFSIFYTQSVETLYLKGVLFKNIDYQSWLSTILEYNFSSDLFASVIIICDAFQFWLFINTANGIFLCNVHGSWNTLHYILLLLLLLLLLLIILIFLLLLFSRNFRKFSK